MRERGGLQVGVNLLDDRVATVGVVGGHGIESLGWLVVKKAWKAPGVEQRRVAGRGFRVEVGEASHDQPSGHLVGFLLPRRLCRGRRG